MNIAYVYSPLYVVFKLNDVSIETLKSRKFAVLDSSMSCVMPHIIFSFLSRAEDEGRTAAGKSHSHLFSFRFFIALVLIVTERKLAYVARLCLHRKYTQTGKPISPDLSFCIVFIDLSFLCFELFQIVLYNFFSNTVNFAFIFK